MTLLWIALLLGLVEGLTEFLPISSTGHLILVSAAVGFQGPRAEVCQVFIQLGAVLALICEYRSRLNRIAIDLRSPGPERRFVWGIALAFVPFAATGFVFHRVIMEQLFTPTSVAAALVVGGVAILIVEALPVANHTVHVGQASWRQAAAVGCAQCLALWPGFSRSAATILGGRLVGMDRRTATEYSFFLAIPTLATATIYALFSNLGLLEPRDTGWLALSLGTSFLVAWLAIRWLLRWVATHDFRPFGWYRIALGLVVLLIQDQIF